MSSGYRPADADRMETIMFMDSPTLGVRRQTLTRTILAREPHEVTTPWGAITGKIAYLPNGARRFSPEYDACHRVAAQEGVALADVLAAAQMAFRSGGDA